MQSTNFVGSIDQGTTSTRFIIWDRAGRSVASEQLEHAQILPKPGYVEHDPSEIWQRTQEVISRALVSAGLSGRDLAAIGITNQRETTVAWDASTGLPLHNALVWQDTRTQTIIDSLNPDDVALLRQRTGLRAATYFSGSKMKVAHALNSWHHPLYFVTFSCSGSWSSLKSHLRSARVG
jgi:glycerol kinase